MLVETDNLITARSIAERLGIERTTVYQWARRFADFPAPVAGDVYHWPDVKAWAKATGRL